MRERQKKACSFCSQDLRFIFLLEAFKKRVHHITCAGLRGAFVWAHSLGIWFVFCSLWDVECDVGCACQEGMKGMGKEEEKGLRIRKEDEKGLRKENKKRLK